MSFDISFATNDTFGVAENDVAPDHPTVRDRVVVPVIAVICEFLGRTPAESVIYCPTWNAPIPILLADTVTVVEVADDADAMLAVADVYTSTSG